jgi:hypothetical protein
MFVLYLDQFVEMEEFVSLEHLVLMLVFSVVLL